MNRLMACPCLWLIFTFADSAVHHNMISYTSMPYNLRQLFSRSYQPPYQLCTWLSETIELTWHFSCSIPITDVTYSLTCAEPFYHLIKLLQWLRKSYILLWHLLEGLRLLGNAHDMLQSVLHPTCLAEDLGCATTHSLTVQDLQVNRTQHSCSNGTSYSLIGLLLHSLHHCLCLRSWHAAYLPYLATTAHLLIGPLLCLCL